MNHDKVSSTTGGESNKINNGSAQHYTPDFMNKCERRLIPLGISSTAEFNAYLSDDTVESPKS